MNPAYRNNANRAVEYKNLVLTVQRISNEITEAINNVNGLMSWKPQTLDVEHLAVSSLDNARQFLAEGADHLQHAANIFSGGSAYRVNRAIAAEPKDTTYSQPVPDPEQEEQPAE